MKMVPLSSGKKNVDICNSLHRLSSNVGSGFFFVDQLVTKIAARHATDLIHKHSTDTSHAWMLEIVPHHHNAPCLFGKSGIRCYFLEKTREKQGGNERESYL